MIEKHGSAVRKGTTITYAVHPLGVMAILLEEQFFDPTISDNVVISGLLHDLNEDAGVSIKEIAEEFNPEVSRIVENLSESEELKKNPDKRGTWKKRKELALEMMKKADKFTKLVFCADKLDNARSIKNNLTSGFNVWKLFNASKEDVLWNYTAALSALKQGESIEHTRVYQLLTKAVQEIS